MQSVNHDVCMFTFHELLGFLLFLLLTNHIDGLCLMCQCTILLIKIIMVVEVVLLFVQLLRKLTTMKENIMLILTAILYLQLINLLKMENEKMIACLFKCFANETMLLNKMHQRRRKIGGKIATTEFNLIFSFCFSSYLFYYF